MLPLFLRSVAAGQPGNCLLSALLRLLPAALSLVALGGCTVAGIAPTATTNAVVASAPQPEQVSDIDPDLLVAAYAAPTKAVATPTALDPLIEHYAQVYDVPAELIHRLVRRESSYNPAARNGPYWGLLQIRHDTAITMGYKGTASGLLDADTNLKYAVKYLRGAYLVAGRNPDKGIRLYASGYYYDAKRLGLLEETGLR